MEGYIDRELALTLVQRLKNWVQGAARQKPVRSWHHLSSIYSVSRILPLPLLLLRTHLRTPLAFVPPFSGVLFVQAQEIRVRASFCMTGARLRTLFRPLAGVVFRAQS